MLSKIVLNKRIENCICYKNKIGYSYELTPFNKTQLLDITPEDFVVPSNFEEINEIINHIKHYIVDWAKVVNMADKIKTSEFKPCKISNTLTLSSYQIKATWFCKVMDRACLFMEQGTGKTPVALTLIYLRKELSHLIICPKAVRQEWAHMIEQFFPELRYEIIKTNLAFNAEPGTIYITNYERMRTMKCCGFNQIFIDECHRIKDPTSETNKALYSLQKSAQYVYGLSGTPYSNNITDIFGIMKVVDERYFGIFKGSFVNHYCLLYQRLNRTTGEQYNEIVGYKNMEEFKRKIDCFSYRVLKKDCLDLKDPIFTRLWVENSKEYQIMKKDYVLPVEDKSSVLKSVLNLTFALQQICSGFTHLEDGKWKVINENKLNTLVDWVKNTITNEQVIIYVTYDMSENMIVNKLKKLNKTVASLSGRVKDKDRELIKEKFKNNELQFLVIKYKSGTEGLNFQNCYKMMFYDLTPSYIDYEQAKSRIHRRGQENECEYIHLITENSVEEKILKALDERKDFSNYILEKGINHDTL